MDSKKSRKNNENSNIATLWSDEKASSSDDDGQAFYVGGSARSGQQVLGPSGSRKDPDEVITSMFKVAKEHGAQVIDKPDEDTSNKRKPNPFQGKGFKLSSAGNEENSAPGTSDSFERNPDPVLMRLKMWRNGFSIDDGPLRAYDDPANQDFLGSISKGQLPRELIGLAKGGEINLNMEDHRAEEYVQPKKKVQAFAGEGYRLGSVTPETIVSPGHNQALESSDSKGDEERAKSKLNLDKSKPTTNLQIRLADGSRITIEANLSHTIQDIRNYICEARPYYGPQPFVLMTSFPNKKLTEETLTLEQLKLENALIIQRLI